MRLSAKHLLGWLLRTEVSRKSASDWCPSASSCSPGTRHRHSHRERLDQRPATVTSGHWREANRRNHYLVWSRPSVSHVREFADDCGATRRRASPRWQLINLIKRVALSITATAILALLFAPISAADPTTHLKSEIDAARRESGCPPLQLDPVVNDVTQHVNRQVDEYVRHAPTARGLPTTGEIDAVATGRGGVLQALRESGYSTSKAKLLSGYGDYRTGGTGGNEAKAVKATVLEGLAFRALADCAYTKYGVSAINDDSSQGWPSTPPRTYTVTTVLLVGA